MDNFITQFQNYNSTRIRNLWAEEFKIFSSNSTLNKYGRIIASPKTTRLVELYLRTCKAELQTRSVTCYGKAAELVQSYGFNPYTPTGREHDHPFAAAARILAERITVIAVIDKHLREGTPTECIIHDYYGGSRLLFLIKKVVQKVTSLFGILEPHWLQFSWYRPILTAKDNAEYGPLLQSYPSSLPDSSMHVLITDVYQMEPADILKERIQFRSLWIIRQFYGVNAVAGVNFCTAAYYIQDHQLIQRAGLRTETWLPHHEFSLWENTSKATYEKRAISWIRKQFVSDYEILLVQEDEIHTLAPYNVPVEKALIVSRRIYSNSIAKSLQLPWFYREYYVFREALPMMSKHQFRTRQTFQLTTVTNMVSELSHKEPYALLFDSMGALLDRNRVVRDTVDYIMWSTIKDEHSTLKYHTEAYGEYVVGIKNIKQTMASSVESAYTWKIPGCIAAAAMFGSLMFPKMRAFIIPCLEETVKTAFPMTAPLLGLYEWLVKDKFQLGWLPIRVLGHMLFTKLQMLGLFLHGVWNYVTPVQMRFSVPFKFYAIPVIMLTMYWIYHRVSTYIVETPTETTPNQEMQSNMLVKFERDYAKLQHMDEEYPEIMATPVGYTLPAYTFGESTVCGCYVLAGSQGMLVRPHGKLAFLAAYDMRNRSSVGPALTACEALCARKENKTCKLWATWQSIRKLWNAVEFEDLPDIKLKRANWVRHFGTVAKRVRAQRACDRRKEGLAQEDTTCFLKSDEVLCPKIENQLYYIKPRVIQAVAPDLQAAACVIIDSILSTIKTTFNLDHRMNSAWGEYTITIGNGMTNTKLDEWFNMAIFEIEMSTSNLAHMIIAGDDFYGLIKENGEVTVYENDFSKFDRTQGIHALSNEYYVCKRIISTLPDASTVINFMERVNWKTPSYLDPDTKMYVQMAAPIQRFSGGPDTTLGNNISHISSLLYVFDQSGDTLDFSFQSHCGFEAKLAIKKLEEGPTFLKGWWLPHSDGQWHWYPLPSQVIKMGKSITDPCRTYPTVEPLIAYRMAAKSIALSFKDVPLVYPILGPFVSKMVALTDQHVEAKQSNPHTVLFGSSDGTNSPGHNNLTLDLEFCYGLYLNRYNLDISAIEKMHSQISSAPFPCIMSGMEWVNLARIDYG